MKSNLLVALTVIANLGLVACGQDAPVEFGSDEVAQASKDSSPDKKDPVIVDPVTPPYTPTGACLENSEGECYVNSTSALFKSGKRVGYLLQGYGTKEASVGKGKTDCKLDSAAECLKLLEAKLALKCRNLGFKNVVGFDAPTDAAAYILSKGLTGPNPSNLVVEQFFLRRTTAKPAQVIPSGLYGAACH